MPISETNGNWEQRASENERRAIEASQRSVNKTEEQAAKDAGIEMALLTTGDIRAKYKIEVTFVEGRTVKGPNRLGIQIWESGKRFHGGGDELMYWCKDNREGCDDGCWAPIPASCINGGVAVCPHCKRMVNEALLTNMRLGYVTSQNLAKELVKIFRSLGSNADIYLKYHKTDIHYVALEKAKGPDVARRLKGMHIYPLKNIIKDTSNGADLEKRFFAFVSS